MLYAMGNGIFKPCDVQYNERISEKKPKEEDIMKIQEVQAIAKAKGIKMGNQKDQTLLIREIQKVEGNYPCYGTATSGVCDQGGCFWRKDCLSLSKR
jgi:hypothetical protein